MPPSPKLGGDSAAYDEKSLLSPRLNLTRRTRRVPLLLSLPLTLFLCYLLLPSMLDQSPLFIAPPAYLSHSGKSALETTVLLPRVQFEFPRGKGGDVVRREKIKEAIQRTWRLYSQEAWGWDEVKPVQGGGRDPRNGWGATIVDGLSTLIIAGLETEAFAALNHTVSVDFTIADGLVDPFETIIRYVGGLISAVDLLEFGFLGSPFDKRGLAAIRKQAEILAHKLAPGLNSPMRMWLPRVDFLSNRGIREDLWGDTSVSCARAGSNILEYGRLSELSTDLEFFRNATAAWWPLIKPRKESVIPGMVASPVSVDDGYSMGDDIQWGAGQDSFYEYLIKAYILWPNVKTELYRDRWILAVENTMRNLSSWSLPTLNHPSYRYLAIHDRRKQNEMGHLTCFAPGNFLLGARVLNRDDIFKFGLDILEGCWHSYNVTPTGVSPETWKWKSNDTADEPHTSISRSEWDKYAFWTVTRDYYLRPETIESYFYAYRMTGNKTYQDWAWQAFQAISATARAPYGYSSIRDVMTPGGWYQADESESFWLAETLKYLYLIFDDPERVSLDDWVFNTEAHPLRRGRRVRWGR